MTTQANILKIERSISSRGQNGKMIRLFGYTPENKWIEKYFHVSYEATEYAAKKGWTVTSISL